MILQVPPFYAASGDADGSVRLWDLRAGNCLHKVKGHDGAVVAINSTEKYVISSGLDDKLCIWDRNKGSILHSLDLVSFLQMFIFLEFGWNVFRVLVT